MAQLEMPAMAASSYQSSNVNLADAAQGLGQISGSNALNKYRNSVLRADLPQRIEPKEDVTMPSRRIVQVFIADTDENVPLDQCILYRGEQKLTDATDQELFFEVDIKSLLDAHNATRVLLVNKAVKERSEKLEPARIRDLKMTVVTIATF